MRFARQTDNVHVGWDGAATRAVCIYPLSGSRKNLRVSSTRSQLSWPRTAFRHQSSSLH